LIRWLIHDISGANASEEVLQFLQSCAVCGSAVIAPEIVMSTAVALLRGAANLTERLRVLRFLSLWSLEFAGRDIITKKFRSSSVFTSMMRFLDKCEKHVELRDHLNSIKLGLLRGYFERSKIAVLTPKSDVEVADLEEITPGIFAEQLTLVVHGFLSDITDQDLYMGDQSPKVGAMIHFWNELSQWCISYLGRDDASASLRLRRLLAIAKRCIELNNYDSAFALGLALDSSKISRAVIESVGSRGQEVIDMLSFITNVSRGFSSLEKKKRKIIFSEKLTFFGEIFRLSFVG
jgi:hypothetical protein